MAEGGSVIPPADERCVRHRPAHRPPFREPGPARLFRRSWRPERGCLADADARRRAGMCFMDGIELDELRQPITVHERRFVRDTEGAGRRRGANSVLVEFGPRGCDIDIIYASDGTANPASGVRGGRSGATARQFKVRADGSREELPTCGRVAIRDGERVRSSSAGGGGYGSPLEREPELVARMFAKTGSPRSALTRSTASS